MTERILPLALRPGDTIGIVSPSWFGGASFISRAERGIAELERLGFRVEIAPHAFNNAGWISDTVENRVADIHAMFRNPEIRAILCSIGGDHACHLLPHLDWDLIRANPKVFMGFSDITVLNLSIWTMTGIVTFNGPALMTDWAEYPEMPSFARESALAALTSIQPIGDLAASATWTDEFLDWETGEDLTRQRVQHESQGWVWLRGGVACGRLIGGCLESLQHLRGTRYWPDLTGAILFLETSESRPSIAEIDALLMDLENMGVFAQIAGLVLGRPYGFTDEKRLAMHAMVVERTRAFDFPIVADVDCGHTSPLMTLPIGCSALLDAGSGRFAIIDAATRW